MICISTSDTAECLPACLCTFEVPHCPSVKCPEGVSGSSYGVPSNQMRRKILNKIYVHVNIEKPSGSNLILYWWKSHGIICPPPPLPKQIGLGRKRGERLNYEIANVATWGHGAWEQFITVIPTSSPPWQVKNLPLIRHGEEAAMPGRVRPAKRLLACSNDGKHPIIMRLNHSWQSIFLSVLLAAKKKKIQDSNFRDY